MVSKTQVILAGNLSPYSPSRSDGSATLGGVIGRYLFLNGLRGFWPMSSVNENGDAVDLSGQGRNLSLGGPVSSAYDQGSQRMHTPFVFVGTTPTSRYLYRADEAGFDITGTETYFADKGVTLGMWVCNTSTIPAGANRLLIGKWDSATNNRSYAIQVDASERPMMSISSNGTDVYSIVSPKNLYGYAAGRVQFVCGRFDLFGNDNISIFVSSWKGSTGADHGFELTKTELDVGIPASIYSGSADFTIGAEPGGVNPMEGSRVSLAFLCASALNDSVIYGLYHMTRHLFKEMTQ